MILTQHGINSLPRNGSDIPFIGTLAHKWVFVGESRSLTDVVGHVTLNQLNPSTPTYGTDGLDISYIHGVSLKVDAAVNDYIELIYHYSTRADTYLHMRLLNITNANSVINDQHCFFINRGDHFYWTAYFSGWNYGIISNDYNFLNGHKVGIFLKSKTTIDIYIDNVLYKENYYCNWWASYPDNGNHYYGVGCTVSSYSSTTPLWCEQIRVFRDCRAKG